MLTYHSDDLGEASCHAARWAKHQKAGDMPAWLVLCHAQPAPKAKLGPKSTFVCSSTWQPQRDRHASCLS